MRGMSNGRSLTHPFCAKWLAWETVEELEGEGEEVGSSLH